MVRSKVRYPSLWDFCVFYRRAKIELLMNYVDLPFSYPLKKYRCYGWQHGLSFTKEQLIALGFTTNCAKQKRDEETKWKDCKG